MSEQACAKRNHLPDKSKLPKSLAALEWQPIPKEFLNGDRLLVAVPVCKDFWVPDGDWYYLIETVAIECDEHFFRVVNNYGENWGWEIYDVDWMVKI